MQGWTGIVALGLLTACSGSAGTGGTTLGDDDDDDATSDDPPRVEEDCDDGLDDDGDGLVDCDDDDCAGEEHCSWPDTVRFDSRLEFEGNTLAELGGYEDCRVVLTSRLERDRSESCDGCDRVFTGGFNFVEDDCPPEFDRPEEGSYGVAFVAADRWEVFGRLDDQWASLGMATDDGSGALTIEDRSPVVYEGLEVGELISQFSFTP